MCADVVIVGGGPIGCWTALQIKKRNPAMHVQIYERYPEYQRDHMLSLRRTSLLRHSKRTHDALETEFLSKISSANNTTQAPTENVRLKRVTYIRTLDFERILKDQCTKHGVSFVYGKIESPQDASRERKGRNERKFAPNTVLTVLVENGKTLRNWAFRAKQNPPIGAGC